MAMTDDDAERAHNLPQSAVPTRIGLAGLAGLSIAWTVAALAIESDLMATWLVLLGAATPMLRGELQRQRRAEPVSSARNQPLLWLAGMAFALIPVALFHLAWADRGFIVQSTLVIVPILALRALVLERASWYGGFQVGLMRWVLRAGPRPGAEAWRLWGLKGLFVPLYAYGFAGLLAMTRSIAIDTPADMLIMLVSLCFLADLAFGLVGYLFASNSLFPSVKSTNSSLLAWLVCLLCYPMFHHGWLDFATVAQAEVTWSRIAAHNASLLVAAGTAVMMAMLLIYLSATVVFGLRFANLANRGIITTGPYRWIKHPAYTAHIVNSWVIVAIFLPAAGMPITPGLMAVPAAFTALYVLRMRAEERHLREDPAYVAYERWIEHHGLIAMIRRAIFGEPRPIARLAGERQPTGSAQR